MIDDSNRAYFRSSAVMKCCCAAVVKCCRFFNFNVVTRLINCSTVEPQHRSTRCLNPQAKRSSNLQQFLDLCLATYDRRTRDNGRMEKSSLGVKDYSTHRQRSFFQESSQPRLPSSLAGGQNTQDWKEEIVWRFCRPKTGAGCRSRGHQIQVFEPC